MYPRFALTLFSLLPLSGHLIQAAPAPVPSSSSSKEGQNPPLRGSKDLVGYSASHDVPIKNTSVQYHLVPGQKQQPNDGRYLKLENVDQPQPVRGNKGGSDPGPRTEEYQRLNSDKLAPPDTDHGQTINAQWPMAFSRNR